MTELVPTLLAVMVALPVSGMALALLVRTPRQANVLALATGLPSATAALAVAAVAFARAGKPALHGRWYLLDGASGVLLAVIAVVGLCSIAVSPAYLRTSGRRWSTAARSRSLYYAALFLFWGALLAAPVAGNLGAAWLIVEATTGASALLVAFSGRRRALEAAWKYLLLTTLGLSVALLGIVVLAIGQANLGHHGFHALDWTMLRGAAHALPRAPTLIAFVLLLAGLASKIGWAPVHNWLPDAHSEAPAPISALLSAALLPSVLLIAWRVKDVLEPSVGSATTHGIFIAFGLTSILVAVPFLWQSLPWKRLLAYSSLEHMGVIALGIGFGTPLAIAGVVLHVAGHALAKALGFYATLPLLRIDPDASGRAPRGVVTASRSTAAAMGVSLLALSGLPPSPLFLSELLIILGGLDAGDTVISVIALVALAAGFLGLLHMLIEGVVGEPTRRHGRAHSRAERPTIALTAILGSGLLALAAAGLLLPGSGLVAALARGAL